MRVPKIIKDFGSHFFKAGYECYLVGGAIRNMTAGRKATDYDFATNAEPEEVKALFRRVIPTGIRHGTVTVLFGGQQFEVTTYRVEGEYSDSRRPDKVEFTPSIYEDLKRRDFTINSMALDVKTGHIIDPHGGRADLKKGVVRAIGEPVQRFEEDPLRMLRACRFAAQLEFEIEAETFEGIRRCVHKIRSVSAERIRDEFEKTILAPTPSTGIFLMDGSGILGIILPELAACKGVTQKGMHRFDVFTHLLLSCDFAEPDVVLRLAALFHDIGKPAARDVREDGTTTFYRHEEISAVMSHSILRRLKFPKYVENKVCHLIRNHMFSYDENWSDSAVRRFISRVGKSDMPYLFRLRRADSYGIVGEQLPLPHLTELERRIDGVIEKDEALSVTDLDIDGNILAEEGGIPKGPIMGTILSHLLETVLDDPSLNTKDKLLEIAKNFYEQQICAGK